MIVTFHHRKTGRFLPVRLFCPCLLVFLLVPVLCRAGLEGDVCRVRPSLVTRLLTGFTRARTVMDIASEVEGRCLTVTAEVGEAVPLSGEFVRIDPTFSRLALKTARLAVARQQATLAHDRRQVERYTQLVRSRASAQIRLEELELKAEQDRLHLEELKVEEERLAERLARHTVRAPAGWLVIGREVEPGEWVTPGHPLARVGDYSRLLVPLLLDEKELSALQSRKTFALRLPGLGISGQGRVLRVKPGFDPASRKTGVDVLLTRETLERLPVRRSGLRVEIPVQVPDPMEAVLVPAAAVRQRYDASWLTLEDGGQVQVTLLGSAEDGGPSPASWLRVTGEGIHPGQRLRCGLGEAAGEH